MKKDVLNLTDTAIPISKRYDAFLLWSHDNPVIIPEVIADELGVELSVVDVFHQLGEFEAEFPAIDGKNVTIDSLFVLVRHENIEVWHQFYDQADTIQGDSQPMNALIQFIDNITIPKYYDIMNEISAKAWLQVANIISDRKIITGTITDKFPSLLKKASRRRASGERISNKMCDWIFRGINLDKQNNLMIFTNENLLQHFTEDYNHFGIIISQLPS